MDILLTSMESPWIPIDYLMVYVGNPWAIHGYPWIVFPWIFIDDQQFNEIVGDCQENRFSSVNEKRSPTRRWGGGGGGVLNRL